MKKFWRTALSVMLALVMAVGLFACRTDEETGGGDGEKIDIAGVYSIDLSEFMSSYVIYLKIEDDGDFVFSDTAEFKTEKSAGTVSKMTSNYLLLFKKVNGEDVSSDGKTCNFEKETDGRLKVVGTIYVGTATIPSPMENDDTGEMVTFYAVPYTGGGSTETETLETGLYFGEDGIYKYYLNLSEDGRFTAFTSFEMTGMGSGFAYDYGTYTLMGAMCRMTSSVYKEKEDDTKALTESVSIEDGVIKADVKMSPFASDTKEITVTAVTSPVGIVATYEGTATVMGSTFDLSMSVRGDGSYQFLSEDASGENEDFTETGFIGIEDMLSGKGVLIPEGITTAGEVVVGEDGSLTFKVPVVAGTPRAEVTLSRVESSAEESIASGTYYGMDDTQMYHYYLNINEDDTFTAFVTFTAMGADCMGYDYGTITEMGGRLLLTSSVYKDTEDKTQPLTESVSIANGIITANVKLSAFAQGTKEITIAVVSEEVGVAAEYEGNKTVMGSDFALKMTVYLDGSYEFTATDVSGENEPYTESGFIGIEDMLSGAGVLIPAEATEVQTVTVAEDGSLTFKIPVVAGTPRAEITLTRITEAVE